MKINEDIFDEWTEESAYLLGFWYDDGYIYLKQRSAEKLSLYYCAEDVYLEKLTDLHFQLFETSPLLTGSLGNGSVLAVIAEITPPEILPPSILCLSLQGKKILWILL